MKRIRQILRTSMFVALLGSVIITANSCEKTPPTGPSLGTVVGLVADGSDTPLAGVTVTVSGVDGTATTGADGKYTVEKVSVATHTVSFAKTGYQTVSVTVTASRFDENKIATANAKLIDASAKIIGTVKDGNNGNAPLEGVTVSAGSAATTVTTNASGAYAIESIALSDYTVTFAKAGYTTLTRNVVKADFVAGVATVDVTIGGGELLRGLTAEALKTAPKWYYNEYKGGTEAQNYPQWDWAVNFMAALTFGPESAWNEEDWGTAIEIRNDAVTGDTNNPVDLDMFDSYMYGSKKITSENKTLSLRVTTGDAVNETVFGVQVIDLSAAEPVAVKVDANKNLALAYPAEKVVKLTDHRDFHFDLSAYAGKEVIIAIGTYRAATGDYNRKLVIRRLAFAKDNVVELDWIAGTYPAGLESWKLPAETIRSIMPNTKTSFSGINYVSLDRGNYADGYQDWRNHNHVCIEWCFVPLNKDPETHASQGFLMKTSGGGSINLNEPEAYLYAKFTVTSANDKMTLRARTFNITNWTYFRLTAVDESNLAVTHVAPTAADSSASHGSEAVAEAPGMWRFMHEGGDGEGDPDGYGKFVYDLSGLNGKTVTLILGVYNGQENGDENKLSMYGIEFE